MGEWAGDKNHRLYCICTVIVSDGTTLDMFYLKGTEKDVSEHMLNDTSKHLEKITIYVTNMEVHSLNTQRKLQVFPNVYFQHLNFIHEHGLVISFLCCNMLLLNQCFKYIGSF